MSQTLNVAFASTPEQYTHLGRITNPGPSFVLAAGAVPKFSVSRTGAGVYVVSLFEAPILFLGADSTPEGAVSNQGATALSNATGYVYAPATGSSRATVTFYTAVSSSATGAFTTTLTDMPFSFQIFCADTNKVG